MGRMMSVLVFPEDVDRGAAYREVDEFCMANCDPWEHGGVAPSGLARPIRWLDSKGVLSDLESAKELLYGPARPDYETWAVRFRSEGTPSKRTEELLERVSRLRTELEVLSDRALPSNRKSALIGCPECGSKLSRAHLGRSERCPLCGTDLRSQSALKSIAAKRDAIKRASGLLRESRIRDGSKAPVMWAVIAEVHC